MRGHSISTGEACITPIEDFECDAIETAEGSFILTRYKEDNLFIVWKQIGGFGSDLDQVDILEMGSFDCEVLDMKTKGKVKSTLGGKEYEMVLVLSSTSEFYALQAFTHVPTNSY